MAKKAKVSKVKVIRESHRIVKSKLRLLLLNKHKKFENDAIARFCSSKKWGEKTKTQKPA